MKNQKRVNIAHGSARVDEDCSEETLKALDQISKIAYETEIEPLNMDDVVCISFVGVLNEAHYKCDRCGEEEWQHKY